jgi:hypothetical protein
VSAQPLGIELKATAKFSPYVELGGGGDFVVCSIGPVIKGNLPGLEFVTDVATYENQPIQLVSYIGWTAPSLELKFEAWDYEKYDCGKGGDVYCTWVDAVWQTVWKTVATSVKRWWGWLTGSEQVSSQELVQVTKTGWGKQRRNVLASVNLKTWTGNAGPRIYIIKYDPYENYMDDATYDCWIGPVRKALTPAKEWVSVGTYTIARSPKMKWSKTTGRSYKNNAGLGYVFEVYPKKLSGWSRYITVKVRKSAYDHGLKVTSWHEVAQKNIFVFRKWYSWDVGTKTVTINDNLRLKFRGINESTSGPWYNPTHVYFDLKITKEEFKVP